MNQNINKKTALVTGINGQDGAYLSRFLLDKNYDVYGVKRRSSTDNLSRLSGIDNDINFIEGDLSDAGNMIDIVNKVKPDEIYNLGAQSHVGTSFDMPEYTANIDALGTLRLLEAIRILGMAGNTKFYQASSSEIFGNTRQSPQNEKTHFEPCSPYGVAKLYAYWTTVNYRQSYGIFACNGILFNHESPIRGAEFVTRKITKSVAKIAKGHDHILMLGNLDAKRDWGHARDYVRGMWMMMQSDQANDYVLATGQSHSVREFATMALSCAGIDVEWDGQGQGEVAKRVDNGDVVVAIDPQFYRPNELRQLVGDATKAKEALGWSPNILLNDMIAEMVEHDLAEVQ